MTHTIGRTATLVRGSSVAGAGEGEGVSVSASEDWGARFGELGTKHVATVDLEPLRFSSCAISMQVKREEAKRVAKGGRHFRRTGRDGAYIGT